MPNHNDTSHDYNNGTNSHQKHSFTRCYDLNSTEFTLTYVIMKVKDLGWLGVEALHKSFLKSY